MRHAQLDMFGTEDELFEPAPVVYRADPARVRQRLGAMLAEAQAADAATWDPERQRLFETIVPQMSLWLEPDEAAQLKLDFEAALSRLG